MSKKALILGVFVAFLSTAAFSAAAGEDVYVTEKGSKYHKQICRLVKNKDNLIELDKEEAIGSDYEPCKRCFKEDLVVNKTAGQKQLSKAAAASE
jgi:methylphosphotriester-DNA--protein-cysteine methyltransferase